eukprot:6274880-Prymnesium_polylepis.1
MLCRVSARRSRSGSSPVCGVRAAGCAIYPSRCRIHYPRWTIALWGTISNAYNAFKCTQTHQGTIPPPDVRQAPRATSASPRALLRQLFASAFRSI